MTAPNLEPLLPCPFCGGRAECHPREKGSTIYAVRCVERYDGRCAAQLGGFRTEGAAMKAWNTRARPLVPSGLTEEEKRGL